MQMLSERYELWAIKVWVGFGDIHYGDYLFFVYLPYEPACRQAG